MALESEIVIKTFEDVRILEFCTPVIFASIKTMSFLKNTLKFYTISWHNDAKQVQHNKVNVVNVWKENANITFGQEDVKIGEYAIKSLGSCHYML